MLNCEDRFCLFLGCVALWSAGMRVAHFNSLLEGGSAMVMLRLHEALLRDGIASRIYYRRGQPQGNHSRQLEFVGKVQRVAERIKDRVESEILIDHRNYFGTLWSPVKTRFEEQKDAADIFHLHNISHWMDLPTFMASVPDPVPIVLTIHDMGNLAGGCHLYSGCVGYQQECRGCPLLRTPFKWLAHWEWQRKQKSLGSRRLHVVGNSRWTTSIARSASVFRNAAGCETIYPALNPDEFVQIEKKTAKEVLGLPTTRPIVGFGCSELTDVNKDFASFLDLLDRVADKTEVEGLVFGNGFRLDRSVRTRIRSLGKLASPQLLSLAYSAMDVLVVTSTMETFGQVAIEAQACGTPVCAFEVGGIPDAVRNGVSGFLVPHGDMAGLTEKVLELLGSVEKRACFATYAREWVRSEFAIERAKEAYLQVYRNALETPLN